MSAIELIESSKLEMIKLVNSSLAQRTARLCRPNLPNTRLNENRPKLLNIGIAEGECEDLTVRKS